MGQFFSLTRKVSVKKYKYPDLNVGMTAKDYEPDWNQHAETMNMVGSDWQWRKFKDMLHYYTMVAVIPLTMAVIYANIFIGPAKLAPIPEGYRPKHWEYYRHPISRFLQKYMFQDDQQDYEKYLHFLYEEDEYYKLRELEKKVKELIKNRNDYQAWYHKPLSANYYRILEESHQDIEDNYNRSPRGP